MKKIMFNDKFALTQAVLDGRKTMTRRMVVLPDKWHGIDVYGFSYVKGETALTLLDGDDFIIEDHATRQIGQILPTYKNKEEVAVAQCYEDAILDVGEEEWNKRHKWYCIENLRKRAGLHNKMFVKADLMPYRIKITDIKVERLQDISDEDCLKEGIFFYNCGIDYGYTFNGIREKYDNPRDAFAVLIDKVSGKGTWESNPWVFAYTFELVK